MKIRILISFASSLSIILLTIGSDISCRNPYEFAPEFDSLMPPPPAPLLLHPIDDTLFREHVPYEIVFEWSNIVGAQCYFFQIAREDSTFSDELKIKEFQTAVPCCTASIGTLRKFYYWRVRGYHKHWTWYTSWSDIWHLLIDSPD